MLFIVPKEQGKGIGKELVQFAIRKYGDDRVCVNGQNPKAHGFYESLGFKAYERSELDEQGNPYPILLLKLD